MNCKITFWLFFLLCCFYGSNYAQSKADTLQASQLKPFGRYQFNAKQQLELISSAVHFGLSFKGSECALYVSIPVCLLEPV